MRYARTILPLLSVLALANACGDEVIVEDPGDQSSTGGSTGPSNPEGPVTPPTPNPTMSARAPSEYFIELTFNKAPPTAAFDAGSYTLTGSHGAVAITAVHQEAGTVIRLETSKQKLGVELSLTMNAGGEWEGLSATFPTADTAVFWTSDLNDPNLGEYQITADRRSVGDHVVIYLQQGMSANNAQQTRDYFDDEAYPIETELFNAAPDRDGNDRIVLLGLDGKGAYGGYFNPVDTLPDAEALENWGRRSNEMEMLYINVESGFFDNDHVVAHELGHLLYMESHGFESGDWSWHNEGMAECAKHAVHGENDYDFWYYAQDPQGSIQTGLSLVNWQWGNFDQYVLSYLFLTYLAGQKEGVGTYGELFHLEGSPASVEAWIQNELGVTFAEAHKRQLLATWLEEQSGVYSYNGMGSFPNAPPVGSGELSLEPFSGAFRQPASPVMYPGTQGPDIVYIGINGLGEIDETEPFDTSGGGLLVFNTNTNMNNISPQPTGNPMPPVMGTGDKRIKAEVAEATRVMTWLHPPPLYPDHLAAVRDWQIVAHGR